MNPVDYKYAMLMSNRIDGFKVKSTNPFKAQMRCPICGDSQKSKSKKRGWFNEYKDGVRFGCFNCGVSLWLGEFLKRVDQVLADEYIVEGKLEWMAGRKPAEMPRTEPKPAKVVPKNAIAKLTKISQLPHNHFAKKYVESRKIPPQQHYRLFYTDDFNGYVNGLIPDKLPKRKEPRLVLPFFDRNKKIYGLQGRSLEPDADIRYLTIMLRDDLPKIYGMEVVDPKMKNYCVEGPIDSLFLPNCWAMAGADTNIGNVLTTYVFDNEPRNEQIVNRMSRLIAQGKNVCMWPEKMQDYGKDINDMIKGGLTSDQIVRIIDNHTYSGLQAELKLKFWRKC
jgi:hypothetical protein